VEKITYNLPVGCLSADLIQYGLLLLPQERPPTVLWVIFGGNAMLSTDWIYFLVGLVQRQSFQDASAAFLLFDYPGYGWNDGRPGPANVLKASLQAIRAALERFSEKEYAPPQVHLLGHSLGTAAASQLAVLLARNGMAGPPGCLLLSAPFLSIPKMAEILILKMPVSSSKWSWKSALISLIVRFLVPHHWNNAREVPAAVAAGWRLGIVHGAGDALVPSVMGRELHRVATTVAAAAGSSSAGGSRGPVYVEVKKAAHNDILMLALHDYGSLMGFGEGNRPSLTQGLPTISV
jgi:hypothetical protein